MFVAIAATSPQKAMSVVMSSCVAKASCRVWTSRDGALTTLIGTGSDVVTDGGTWSAIGAARLTQPAAAMPVCDTSSLNTTLQRDLTQLLSEHTSGGEAAFKRVGEFSVALWNGHARELIAVRDPLGVAPLYYQLLDEAIVVSNSLAAFKFSDIDRDYVADFVMSAGVSLDRTVRAGVLPLPPGSFLRWSAGHAQVHRYWSPDQVRALASIDPHEAAAEFRRLFELGVGACLDPGRQTWAHLSGGLDSSSVVSVAAALAEKSNEESPLGGTITITDGLGDADESDYADAVIRRFHLRNERIADYWPWRDDGERPPLTDQPARDYPFYARDRRIGSLIADAGGTVLLSGMAADNYLPVTTAHIPDLMWDGHIREAARQLLRWTIVTRDSLWKTAYWQLLFPLLTRRGDRLGQQADLEIPAWVSDDFGEQCRARVAARRAQDGPRDRGFFHQGATTRHLARLSAWLPGWFELPNIALRHPFMYLPLVEFALSLPPLLKTDLYNTKAILRTAMKGLLPEVIRRRVTKARSDPRMSWAVVRERSRLSRLLEGPVLADLGCINPAKLRQVVATWGSAGGSPIAPLYCTLGLETWLSVKSGRWS